jgi:hypothetical protein
MKKLFYTFALAIGLCACEKENNAADFSGTYTGTFNTIIAGKMHVEPAELVLQRPGFNMTKGPKFSSGNFEVKDKMRINFTDTNVWPANFDFNLVLNGTYKYEALGDSLILTKMLPIENPSSTLMHYQYRLKRSPK